LYWLFIEAGWKVALVMVVTSAILGPGAGICVGWIYREQHVDLDGRTPAVAVGVTRHDQPSEESPLLR
jgi:hypothetical protein